VLQSIGFVNILATLADHDTKFDFPVGFFRPARDFNVVVRSDDCRRPFAENHRLRRNIQAGFGCMVGVVQSDTDKLANAADARAEAQILLRLPRDERQFRRVEGLQF